MIIKEKRRPIDRQQILLAVVLVLGAIAALALRIKLYPTITSDYTSFLSRWYDYIQANGGFASLKDNFANYNPPYLYLLTIATYLPIDKLVAIKSISVIFDGLLAVFTYLIVRLRYRRTLAATIATLVLLFAPTIFLNSAYWGQCDAIYTSFCLGSLYFLFKKKPILACVFFGIAFAFKLQAIFFLPVLLIVLIQQKYPLERLIGALALIPLIFLLALTPAFIAGRSAGSLLSIYTQQTEDGGVGGAQFQRTGTTNNGAFPGQAGGYANGEGRNNGNGGMVPGQTGESGQANQGTQNSNEQGFQGGQGPQNTNGQGFQGGQQGGGNTLESGSFTYNSPTIYQWIEANGSNFWKWFGIGLAGLFVIGIAALVLFSKKTLTLDIIMKVALVLVLGIPFLLPEMHERYFYLADVFSIVFAFYFPVLCFVPIVIQLCSLSSYSPYLWNNEIVSLAVVAGAVLIMVLVTVMDLTMTLYPSFRTMIMHPETVDEAKNSPSDLPATTIRPEPDQKISS